MATAVAYKPKVKTKTVCRYCGREIKWIRPKGGTRSFPVEARTVYFLPDESGREFLCPDGKTRRGREASDGLPGFFPHDCLEKQLAFAPKARTEKELARRQWA